jgi:sugar/nucleoside kinase (ribokinase family)
MRRKYTIIAFGEPLTEVFLKRIPTGQEFHSSYLMSELLRSSPVHATSGDVFNFLGSYACLKKIVAKDLGLLRETVGLLTETGRDMFGRNLKNALLRSTDNSIRIDKTLFRLVPGTKSGVYGVYVKDEKGDYQFYFDRFGYAFENALNEKTLDKWIRIGTNACYFYTTGIALTMTRKYHLYKNLFQELKRQKTKIIFDTNFREAILEYNNIRDYRGFLEELYPFINILLAGEGDLRNIHKEFCSLKTEQLVEDFFLYWQKLGLSGDKVIIKCGEKGVYYYKDRIFSRSIIKVNPSDCEYGILHPEGAGDAFNAGFILRIVHGGTIEEGINLGKLTASLKIKHQGCFRGNTPYKKHEEEIIKVWRN